VNGEAFFWLARVLTTYGDKLSPSAHAIIAERIAGATPPAGAGEAVAWYTDDHLTDRSATTYDPVVAARWRAKGWPVSCLYAAPTPLPEAVRELLAVIHGDGGHYTIEHGIEKSCADAIVKWQAATRLDALLDASGREWLAIESAPRDGTRVLLFSADRCGHCPPGATGVLVGWWQGNGWAVGKLQAGPYAYFSHEPSHWQPLPTAPTPTERNDG
jgi:hypothetical protein